MSYSGGLIYVDDTTTPVTGISIGDVQQALGATAHDVGSLCRSVLINKWSKCKPIRVANVVTPITAAQRQAANYGFSVSEVTGTPETIALSAASGWVYNRPTSGYPYRLTDFDQYFKFAKCPMEITQSFTALAAQGLPEAAVLAIDGDVVGLDTQYNVCVGDIFDITRYGSYRLTMAVVDNTTTPASVVCYYCSPYTLNDPEAMANEEHTVTVRKIPASCNPVIGRTYTAILMMSNYTPQTEDECKDGILPSAMTSVTAVSLNLDNGNDRFQFEYQQSSTPMTWVLDELYIGSQGITTISGAPANVEVFTMDNLYVELTASQASMSLLQSMQIKASISINGTHYMWTGSGPDDVSSWQVRSGGTYDVTNWLNVSDFSPNVGTTLMDLGSLSNYHLTGYGNGYPILLDSMDYPTSITVHIYYRIGGSGAGTQVLGDGGTINNQGDYIDIQN